MHHPIFFILNLLLFFKLFLIWDCDHLTFSRVGMGLYMFARFHKSETVILVCVPDLSKFVVLIFTG